MQTNRRKYEREYLAYFDIARSIAHNVSLACDLKDHLLAVHSASGAELSGAGIPTNVPSAAPSLLIDVATTPSVISDTTFGQPQSVAAAPSETEILAVTLFFKVLPLVITNTIPPSSSILTTLTTLLVDLGKIFIANRANVVQVNFLRKFLKTAKPIISLAPIPVVSSVSSSAAAVVASSSSTSSIPSHLLTLQKSPLPSAQQTVQQSTISQNSLLDGLPQTTTTSPPPSSASPSPSASTSPSSKALESRISLISLITPTVFLAQNSRQGITTYLEMLQILTSVNSEISSEEEAEISKSFQIGTHVPNVIQVGGQEVVEKLFEILVRQFHQETICGDFSSTLFFDFP
jgi:hypothetical protein